MNKKIDIFVNGEYVCSTNASNSLKEAEEKFITNQKWMGLGGIRTLDDWKKLRGSEIVKITTHWATK